MDEQAQERFELGRVGCGVEAGERVAGVADLVAWKLEAGALGELVGEGGVLGVAGGELLVEVCEAVLEQGGVEAAGFECGGRSPTQRRR